MMLSPFRSVDSGKLVAFAQELVQTPSISGQEGQVAGLVANEMRKVGFDEVWINGTGSVIGRIGPGSGPRLMYDAHLDTVGVGDAEQWKHDPFGGEIIGGILYGRGACDMKGALAAMVYAGKAVVESGQALIGDLYLVAVVQEEPCEGAAIRKVIEGGARPDWVLLGEPTNLQLSRGQRGRIEFRINVRGRSCHSSAPELGVNAIYEAARAIVGLELLAPQLNQDSFLGKGTLAVTGIASSSSSRNAVPDGCTLYIDRRLASGETEAKAQSELRRVLAREGVDATIEVTTFQSRTYNGSELQGRQHFPVWVTAEDDPFLRQVAEAAEAVLGSAPRVGKWDFSTDGVYTAGVAGIPTVGFGPGEERLAHTVDEQVRLRDLDVAAQVYAELAARMLGGGDGQVR